MPASLDLQTDLATCTVYSVTPRTSTLVRLVNRLAQDHGITCAQALRHLTIRYCDAHNRLTNAMTGRVFLLTTTLA